MIRKVIGLILMLNLPVTGLAQDNIFTEAEISPGRVAQGQEVFLLLSTAELTCGITESNPQVDIDGMEITFTTDVTPAACTGVLLPRLTGQYSLGGLLQGEYRLRWIQNLPLGPVENELTFEVLAPGAVPVPLFSNWGLSLAVLIMAFFFGLGLLKISHLSRPR